MTPVSSQKSFEELLISLNDFGKVSGLPLNKAKCAVLRLGSLKHTNIPFCRKYNWQITQTTALGITFTNSTIEMEKVNFTDKILEFEACLEKWKKWNLSLLGKITVIKTFAFPKLLYPLTVLETPSEACLKLIQNKMYNFLWNGKPDKISRNQIIQEYENGGLKMLNISLFVKAIKASWVKRIMLNKQSKWVKLYMQMMKHVGEDLVFKSNLDPKTIENLQLKSVFLLEVIQSWALYIYKNDTATVAKEIIWNNSKIKLPNKKTFFYQEWHDNGVKYIEHLYDYRKNSFYDFNELTRLYGIGTHDFLKYHALISSIPDDWKTRLKNEGTN